MCGYDEELCQQSKTSNCEKYWINRANNRDDEVVPPTKQLTLFGYNEVWCV